MVHGLSNNVRKKMVEEATKERRRLGQETEQQILLLILESEPIGMTTSELVKTTGKDRRTVHKVCREHQKRGLIRPKTSRLGRYHVTDKVTTKVKPTDDPAIGAMVIQLHMMKTGLFGLGEVALTTSMDFCDGASIEKLLEEYRKNPNTIQRKDVLGKFLLFEFALRMGSSLLYIMIQSMKYTNSSLKMSESRRNQLIMKRYETAVNPTLLKGTFEILLFILEQRLWKEYLYPLPQSPDPPHRLEDELEDDKMEKSREKKLSKNRKEMDTWRKGIMDERFKEMEKIYRATFPIVFEVMHKIGYDLVF